MPKTTYVWDELSDNVIEEYEDGILSASYAHEPGLYGNSLDEFHRAPLFSAAHSVSPDAITELIRAGADLQVTDFEGKSELEFLRNSGYDRTDEDFQRAQAALSLR